MPGCVRGVVPGTKVGMDGRRGDVEALRPEGPVDGRHPVGGAVRHAMGGGEHEIRPDDHARAELAEGVLDGDDRAPQAVGIARGGPCRTAQAGLREKGGDGKGEDGQGAHGVPMP